MYTIELVWNREFHFCRRGEKYPTKEAAIIAAQSLLDSGDGAGVKKARVLNEEEGVIWNG